jgi:hypothetical protein
MDPKPRRRDVPDSLPRRDDDTPARPDSVRPRDRSQDTLPDSLPPGEEEPVERPTDDSVA